jgi:hypothetical protein
VKARRYPRPLQARDGSSDPSEATIRVPTPSRCRLSDLRGVGRLGTSEFITVDCEQQHACSDADCRRAHTGYRCWVECNPDRARLSCDGVEVGNADSAVRLGGEYPVREVEPLAAVKAQTSLLKRKRTGTFSVLEFGKRNLRLLFSRAGILAQFRESGECFQTLACSISDKRVTRPRCEK